VDEFIKAEMHLYSAYLSTGNGDVWRVWFGRDGLPLIERLTPNQIRELSAMRRRAKLSADEIYRRAMAAMFEPRRQSP
jgi:hypothetical protein